MRHDTVTWYFDETRLWDRGAQPSGSVAARNIANSLYFEVRKDQLAEKLTIVSKDSLNRSRRPIAWLGKQRLNSHFSISHGERFVAVACSRSRRIGIDVVDAPKISERALQWALSPSERKWIQSDPIRIRQIWSAKEAAFKASRLKRFFPRQIEILNCDDSPHADVGSLQIKIQWLIVGSATVSLASRLSCIWNRIDNLFERCPI